ncbi:unnamed protein product [Amoebophrya sp. A120]|nr:unnamed protein product [Amoebophrya sp. A120]|eukprot:GSA120T00022917001.1
MSTTKRRSAPVQELPSNLLRHEQILASEQELQVEEVAENSKETKKSKSENAGAAVPLKDVLTTPCTTTSSQLNHFPVSAFLVSCKRAQHQAAKGAAWSTSQRHFGEAGAVLQRVRKCHAEKVEKLVQAERELYLVKRLQDAYAELGVLDSRARAASTVEPCSVKTGTNDQQQDEQTKEAEQLKKEKEKEIQGLIDLIALLAREGQQGGPEGVAHAAGRSFSDVVEKEKQQNKSPATTAVEAATCGRNYKTTADISRGGSRTFTGGVPGAIEKLLSKNGSLLTTPATGVPSDFDDPLNSCESEVDRLAEELRQSPDTILPPKVLVEQRYNLVGGKGISKGQGGDKNKSASPVVNDVANSIVNANKKEQEPPAPTRTISRPQSTSFWQGGRIIFSGFLGKKGSYDKSTEQATTGGFFSQFVPQGRPKMGLNFFPAKGGFVHPFKGSFVKGKDGGPPRGTQKNGTITSSTHDSTNYSKGGHQLQANYNAKGTNNKARGDEMTSSKSVHQQSGGEQQGMNTAQLNICAKNNDDKPSGDSQSTRRFSSSAIHLAAEVFSLVAHNGWLTAKEICDLQLTNGKILVSLHSETLLLVPHLPPHVFLTDFVDWSSPKRHVATGVVVPADFEVRHGTSKNDVDVGATMLQDQIDCLPQSNYDQVVTINTGAKQSFSATATAFPFSATATATETAVTPTADLAAIEVGPELVLPPDFLLDEVRAPVSPSRGRDTSERQTVQLPGSDRAEQASPPLAAPNGAASCEEEVMQMKQDSSGAMVHFALLQGPLHRLSSKTALAIEFLQHFLHRNAVTSYYVQGMRGYEDEVRLVLSRGNDIFHIKNGTCRGPDPAKMLNMKQANPVVAKRGAGTRTDGKIEAEMLFPNARIVRWKVGGRTVHWKNQSQEQQQTLLKTDTAATQVENRMDRTNEKEQVKMIQQNYTHGTTSGTSAVVSTHAPAPTSTTTTPPFQMEITATSGKVKGQATPRRIEYLTGLVNLRGKEKNQHEHYATGANNNASKLQLLAGNSNYDDKKAPAALDPIVNKLQNQKPRLLVSFPGDEVNRRAQDVSSDSEDSVLVDENANPTSGSAVLQQDYVDSEVFFLANMALKFRFYREGNDLCRRDDCFSFYVLRCKIEEVLLRGTEDGSSGEDQPVVMPAGSSKDHAADPEVPGGPQQGMVCSDTNLLSTAPPAAAEPPTPPADYFYYESNLDPVAVARSKVSPYFAQKLQAVKEQKGLGQRGSKLVGVQVDGKTSNRLDSRSAQKTEDGRMLPQYKMTLSSATSTSCRPKSSMITFALFADTPVPEATILDANAARRGGRGELQTLMQLQAQSSSTTATAALEDDVTHVAPAALKPIQDLHQVRFVYSRELAEGEMWGEATFAPNTFHPYRRLPDLPADYKRKLDAPYALPDTVGIEILEYPAVMHVEEEVKSLDNKVVLSPAVWVVGNVRKKLAWCQHDLDLYSSPTISQFLGGRQRYFQFRLGMRKRKSKSKVVKNTTINEKTTTANNQGSGQQQEVIFNSAPATSSSSSSSSSSGINKKHLQAPDPLDDPDQQDLLQVWITDVSATVEKNTGIMSSSSPSNDEEEFLHQDIHPNSDHVRDNNDDPTSLDLQYPPLKLFANGKVLTSWDAVKFSVTAGYVGRTGLPIDLRRLVPDDTLRLHVEEDFETVGLVCSGGNSKVFGEAAAGTRPRSPPEVMGLV